MITISRIILKFKNKIWSILYRKSIKKTIPQFKYDINYADPIINNSATELEVNINNITHFVISDLLPIVGVSPYPINELMLMTATICSIKPDYLFEWGTHLGISARIFYEISKNYSLNIEIHSIELADEADHIEHPCEQCGIKVKGINEVQLHRGDGLETSLEIASKLSNNKKLFFFLDGDHSYKSVKRELTGIGNKYPNMSMLIHDTFFQSSESGYNIGPYQAIQDFIRQNKSYKVISTNIGLPGMTFLMSVS